jgi:hypothetical protein
MQQRVQQHRAVTVRKNETVAVRPVWIARVVAQVATPEHFGDFSHSHGHAGVAGVGLLHRVHGQGADDVGQGGKRNRHDNLPIRSRLLGRMGKLSAKTAGIATFPCDAARGGGCL